jgi:hypothetical protein
MFDDVFFKHHPNADFDEEYDGECYGQLRRTVRCRVCGSTDVRWRQQTGKWMLFSTTPGVIHECAPEDLAKDFD